MKELKGKVKRRRRFSLDLRPFTFSHGDPRLRTLGHDPEGGVDRDEELVAVREPLRKKDRRAEGCRLPRNVRTRRFPIAASTPPTMAYSVW